MLIRPRKRWTLVRPPVRNTPPICFSLRWRRDDDAWSEDLDLFALLVSADAGTGMYCQVDYLRFSSTGCNAYPDSGGVLLNRDDTLGTEGGDSSIEDRDLAGDNETITFDPSKIHAACIKVVIGVEIWPVGNQYLFSQAPLAHIRRHNESGSIEYDRANLTEQFGGSSAVVFGAMERTGSTSWKWTPIMQGYPHANDIHFADWNS